MTSAGMRIAEQLVGETMEASDGVSVARYYFLPGQIADEAFVVRVTRVPVQDWDRRRVADVEDVVLERTSARAGDAA